MDQIEIMLVDDHTLFRQGVKAALAAHPDLRIVAEASDANQAIALAEQLSPKVIITEIRLPTLSGLELTRRIRLNDPTIGIIILTGSDEDEQLFEAIKVGAAGYYSKSIRPEDLVASIRRVARSEYPINDNVLTRPTVASRVLEQFRELSLTGQEMEPLFVPLSNREIEVLDCIARGNSNKEIARQLGISDQTVKNHITSILRKLNVNDRTQAVVLSLRRGWIKIE